MNSKAFCYSRKFNKTMYIEDLMNENELFKYIAKCFSALGADKDEVLRYLKSEVGTSLSSILDKYGRLVPLEQEVKGFKVQSVHNDDDVYTVDLAIDSGGSLTPAARVIFDSTATA